MLTWLGHPSSDFTPQQAIDRTCPKSALAASLEGAEENFARGTERDPVHAQRQQFRIDKRFEITEMVHKRKKRATKKP